MPRRSARAILIAVIVLCSVPAGTMGLEALAAPSATQQLPGDLPIDLPDDDLPDEDLPIDLPDDDGSSGSPDGTPNGSPSGSPTGLPTPLPTDLPTLLPTETPTGLPTTAPTDAGALDQASAVWISYAGKRFIGAVTSAQPLCQVGRTVVLKRMGSGKARSIGRLETGPDATWAMNKATTKPGRYFAVVKPMELPLASCLADRSETKRIRNR